MKAKLKTLNFQISEEKYMKMKNYIDSKNEQLNHMDRKISIRSLSYELFSEGFNNKFK